MEDLVSMAAPCLPRELCMRFGYCGEEYEEILRELNQSGKKKLFLSS